MNPHSNAMPQNATTIGSNRFTYADTAARPSRFQCGGDSSESANERSFEEDP